MTLSSGATVWTVDRRKFRLGPLLKSGGAGSVYPLLESPLQVAKIYHASVDAWQNERKLAAMLDLSPHLPDLIENGRRYVQIAWPQAVLRDDRARFVGFLMPAVDVASTSELECILQERQAKASGLPTGLGAKVTLAANLSVVIAELHRQNHHVIDLKPVNLRFYPKSLYMAILDCDGFSIHGQGEEFPAEQITPDYLAPEFQNQPIRAALEEQQDRFALAVVIFQLLNFGIHPFTGRPANDDVPTDIPGRIARRCYAYGRRPNLHLAPNPGSGHQALPADLRGLFDRAFEGNGAARPSASEWAASLLTYAQRANQRLVICDANNAHQHFAGFPCAACARAALIEATAKTRAAATGLYPNLRAVRGEAGVGVARLGGSPPHSPLALRPVVPSGHLIASSWPTSASIASTPAPSSTSWSSRSRQSKFDLLVRWFFALVLLGGALYQCSLEPKANRTTSYDMSATPSVLVDASATQSDRRTCVADESAGPTFRVRTPIACQMR